jgi:hypothetical protein
MVLAVVIVGDWSEDAGDGAVEPPPPQPHTKTSNDAMNARVILGPLVEHGWCSSSTGGMDDDSVWKTFSLADATRLLSIMQNERAETCSRHRAFTRY